MIQKGGVSVPAWIVVSLIILVILIALVIVFTWTTKTNLETAFTETVKSTSQQACAIAGPLQGLLCPPTSS